MTRILMVEDHAFFSQALEMLLGDRLSDRGADPAEFRRAVTLADGLRIAEEEGPFDVAIVDLLLPDGDGTDVVRALKGSIPETPVAVLSAVEDLSGALAAGADEAINKEVPFSLALDRIARLASGGGQATA